MLKKITDNNKLKYLKEIVSEYIDIYDNPYDFKDDITKRKDFFIFPIITEFFVFSDESEFYGKNLIQYCINNNYESLFVINTEFITNEKHISQDEEWSLSYEFYPKQDNLFTIRSHFNYALSALLFPENLSFLVLMTDSYDLLFGRRFFIEKIFGDDIYTSMKKLSLDKENWRFKNCDSLIEKYEGIFYSNSEL